MTPSPYMQTFFIFTCSKLPSRKILGIGLILFFFACKDSNKPPENDIVEMPQQLEQRKSENLRKLLNYATENAAKINDSVRLTSLELVHAVYLNNNFHPVWSREDKWLSITDSLFEVVEHAKEYGLFPADYNYLPLAAIRAKIQTDSVSSRNAALWTRADVLFTDAFMHIAKHLKLGRLERDSITLRIDSLINDQYFLRMFSDAVSKGNIIESLQNLEPKYPEYKKIRAGIRNFLDSADFSDFTYLSYPYKDSLTFIKTIQQRLSEERDLGMQIHPEDSASMFGAIMKYQQLKNLKPTGRISEFLVRSLNNTDLWKFKSIAITLDRYKLLPDPLPKSYLLVNIPSYTLYVYNKDTLVLESKVIVGSPKTKTPLLNSRISNFVIYPQWTVPYSIIFKEMLPQIKKDISYLDKENLMVVDAYDSVIDPSYIEWNELNKDNFPYLIRQREGDDNSLGVIKFNFLNKYSVYLHDTNARGLFNKSERALSHGCVRVQDWEELSYYLTRSDTVRFPPDSLSAWISRQEKHTVTGFPKLPLYIRYFTVEGRNGKLKFYNDIYGYDKLLKEKYFAKKSLLSSKNSSLLSVF